MSSLFQVPTKTGPQKAEVIIPNGQVQRLKGTCFRGKALKLSGNFSEWEYFGDFLKDPEVQNQLPKKLGALIDKNNVHVFHRLELKFNREIGWDSVISEDEITNEQLKKAEIHEPNKRCKLLMMPQDIVKAPRTQIATIVLRMCYRNYWEFILGTLYPGPDCGRLQGDLTQSGLIWLGWSNKGE